MKKTFLTSLLVVLVMTACQKNEYFVPASEDGTLSATIEEVTATKTYMDDDNNILWSEGDQIIAFMQSSLGVKYQVSSASVGQTSARFDVVKSSDNVLNAGTELEHNVAYYPFSDAIKCLKSGNSYSLQVSLPSEQTYAKDTFGNGAMPMVAVSKDNYINFCNVCGGMKLQLRGTQKVTSIRLEGRAGEKLSGAATVNAYIDATKPAITMDSSSSTYVTLDCGSGVQLDESTATEFIISLPPVLFSEGFDVVVTDSSGNTYTVGTDKANTVLRSSLLVMPAFRLGDRPDGDQSGIPVTKIYIDVNSLTLLPSTSYTILTDLEPFNASDKTLAWSSSDSAVATVDQNGKVVAMSDGQAVITIASANTSATCLVTVKTTSASATVDYIDEYGVNHGKGIAIGNTVWAPVNCGYKAASSTGKGFPYGKHYQWGRRYGQGYSSYYDEAVPEVVSGPVSPSVGQSPDNADKLYYNSSAPSDWCKMPNDSFWNAGTESAPVKTGYDPCPEGWRVPTNSEYKDLIQNHSLWTADDSNRKGYWLSGEYTYMDQAPQVFLPAAGYRSSVDGDAVLRDTYGRYWSSRYYSEGKGAHDMRFDHNKIGVAYDYINYFYRANAFSVRCVQE